MLAVGQTLTESAIHCANQVGLLGSFVGAINDVTTFAGLWVAIFVRMANSFAGATLATVRRWR